MNNKKNIEELFSDKDKDYLSFDLEKFVTAQERDFSTALSEMTKGKKSTHWIWYIFPQVYGLGQSDYAKKYGIKSIAEAEAYLAHPILGKRLRGITNVLLSHKDKSAEYIFGGLDAMKVRSCMTLFNIVSPNDVFQEVIDVFYGEKTDTKTLQLLNLEEKEPEKTHHPSTRQAMSVNRPQHLYTPEQITTLLPNEVFVFGSNLDGHHGGGAARAAMDRFGAVWGQGVGLHGQSYAIPTMQGGIETIKPYVDEFIAFAKEHSELVFLVTRIGCGIAGFKDEDIAPLFTDAVDVKNIVLPESFMDCIISMKDANMEMPQYMVIKVHGQTATLVDMLIELNKERHFTSPIEALSCLKKYLEHLRTDGDEVAFNCSIRSLCNCCKDCFPNGSLDTKLLKQNLDRLPCKGVRKVYKDYVIEKTVKLIAMMNEFRRYTNPKDIADDFLKATGGVNHCGPQNKAYYFGFGSPGGYNYIQFYLVNYMKRFWKEFAPNGVLDNKLFRDFMIERHQRGIKKFGLEAVIERNYVPDGICHPEVYISNRGGAGPVYIRDKENRKWIKSCGEGKGFNRNAEFFEYSRIMRCVRQDKNYVLVPDVDSTSYGRDYLYLIPRYDCTLPVFNATPFRYCKLDFESEEAKRDFIANKMKYVPQFENDGSYNYRIYQVGWNNFYWFDPDTTNSPVYKLDKEGLIEMKFTNIESKNELIKQLEGNEIDLKL